MTAIARIIAAETAAPTTPRAGFRPFAIVAKAAERARRARQADMLKAKPDYLLDDMGITRDQAEKARFLD